MHRNWLAPMVLFVFVVALFWRVTTNDFINFDDPGYVYENPHVVSGLSAANVAWAFRSVEMQNWHPLTWLSHQTDATLFGMNPAGHHLTSVLLHACTTLLLFLFFRRTTGGTGQSLLVAALFAAHPLHVESVAWVAERKDVLSGLFWMLTLLAYARYAEHPGGARYLLVVTAFALGLLAKPMLVTLPCVLLLLDYWPLGRLWPATGTPHSRYPPTTAARAVLEKLPLLALALAASVITVYAQRSGGAMSPLGEVSFDLRLSNALVSWVRYVVKMLYPAGLSVLYPFEFQVATWKVAGSAILLFAGSAVALYLARSRRYLPVGWLWYLGTLVPVIGFVQVGSQSMADRFTYLPLIGLFVMVAWGLPDLLTRLSFPRTLLRAVGVVVVCGLAAVTWVRIGDWKDAISILSQSLRVTQDNLIAHHNLGLALAKAGRHEEAIAQIREAIRIAPDFADAYYSLGNQMMQAGANDEALRLFRQATRLAPGLALAYNNAGVVLNDLGRHGEAIAQFQQALSLSPGALGVRYNLAMALFRVGRLQEAASECTEVLRLDPDHRNARKMLDFISAR